MTPKSVRFKEDDGMTESIMSSPRDKHELQNIEDGKSKEIPQST